MRRVGESVLSVKVPDSIVEGLNRHIARLQADNPGLSLSKSDAVRALLTQALASVESNHSSR